MSRENRNPSRRRFAGISAAILAISRFAIDLVPIRSFARGFSLDRFGIRKLFPTLRNGRVWFSTWDNAHPRVLASGERDPDDPMFIVRGDTAEPFQVTIDGNGTGTISGPAPRMYVYDEAQQL